MQGLTAMFVSYAQNFEDVALWRALKHVRNGFFVDLGAQHPVIDSVTRAFSDHGWRGLHVEPVPHYAALLRQDRPGDAVVEKAIGAAPGRMTLHVIEDSGLSTLDAEAARAGEKWLGRTSHAIEVEVITLDMLLAPYAGQDIHFMKIDIEGAEEAALSGWSSDRFRPWIILIEATLPNSQTPSHYGWEPILIRNKYVFAYFDGLNRFYVAREHADLIAPISKPPSVFDGYVLDAIARRDREIADLKSELLAIRSPLRWLVSGPMAFARRAMRAIRRRF